VSDVIGTLPFANWGGLGGPYLKTPPPPQVFFFFFFFFPPFSPTTPPPHHLGGGGAPFFFFFFWPTQLLPCAARLGWSSVIPGPARPKITLSDAMVEGGPSMWRPRKGRQRLALVSGIGGPRLSMNTARPRRSWRRSIRVQPKLPTEEGKWELV